MKEFWHDIMHCGCDCGELSTLFIYNHKKEWLKHLFSAKDDIEWLTKLLHQGEISKFQFNWLVKLFEDKAHDERKYAETWWNSIFTRTYYTGSFDVTTVPSFVANLGRKTHKTWYNKVVKRNQSSHTSVEHSHVSNGSQSITESKHTTTLVDTTHTHETSGHHTTVTGGVYAHGFIPSGGRIAANPLYHRPVMV